MLIATSRRFPEGALSQKYALRHPPVECSRQQPRIVSAKRMAAQRTKGEGATRKRLVLLDERTFDEWTCSSSTGEPNRDVARAEHANSTSQPRRLRDVKR
jgi:hypothetical protein